MKLKEVHFLKSIILNLAISLIYYIHAKTIQLNLDIVSIKFRHFHKTQNDKK